MSIADLLFAVFVAFYAYRGFHRGLIREGLDLLGFALGIALGLRLYPVLGAVFRFVGLGRGWSNILGGSLIFIAFVAGSAMLANRIHSATGDSGMAKPLKVGGAVFASIWSALFAAFMMVVLTVIPSPDGAQTAVRDSFVGRTLLSGSSPVYPLLQDYAKHEARNLLFYLRQYFTQLDTKKQPQHESEEFFKLQASNDIDADVAAEKEIFDLVNKERRDRGLPTLHLFVKIQEVARGHSSDMYKRGYFAHTNPDGKDPFDRMAAGGVHFTYAGENLALAPTVAMVHQGLMNSPKHKDNILKPEFTDLGIGVFKGPYGLMVTQNFCAGCRG